MEQFSNANYQNVIDEINQKIEHGEIKVIEANNEAVGVKDSENQEEVLYLYDKFADIEFQVMNSYDSVVKEFRSKFEGKEFPYITVDLDDYIESREKTENEASYSGIDEVSA